MTQAFHNKIKKDIKKAHPNYSKEKLEEATNGTMATIGKRQAKKSSGKAWSGPKGKRGKTKAKKK